MLTGRAVRPARRRDPRIRFRNRLLVGMVGVALLPLITFAVLAAVELDSVAKSTADATEAAILQHQEDLQTATLQGNARLIDTRMSAIGSELAILAAPLAQALRTIPATTPLPPDPGRDRGVDYYGSQDSGTTLLVVAGGAPTDGRFAAASATAATAVTAMRKSFPEIETVWVGDGRTGALRAFPGFDAPSAVAAGRVNPGHPEPSSRTKPFVESQDRVLSAPAAAWDDPDGQGRDSGAAYWTDPYSSFETGAAGVTAWLPIGGGTQVVVGADVSVVQLFSTAMAGVPAADTSAGSYPMLVSGSGALVYAADQAAADFTGSTVGGPLRLPSGMANSFAGVERTGQPGASPVSATLDRVAKEVFTAPIYAGRWLLVKPVPLSDLEPNLSSLTLGVNAGVHRLFPVTVLPVVVLLVVLAFIAATLLTRRMVLPVRALTDHAVLEERTRLAHEIHDTLAQQLTGIVLELEAADTLLTRGSDRARQSVDTARDLSRAALQEARRSVWNLRPAPLSATGLVAAIGNEVEAWEERTGIPARFRARSMPSHPSLQPAAEVALLRITQEALTNIARHSRAARADVELRVAGADAVLTVQDDGAGFDVTGNRPREDCFGLDGMNERATLAGGTLTVISSAGRGTTVTARVPLAEVSTVADSA